MPPRRGRPSTAVVSSIDFRVGVLLAALGLLVSLPAAAQPPPVPPIFEHARLAERVVQTGRQVHTTLAVRAVRPEAFGVRDAYVRSYRARASVGVDSRVTPVNPYAGLGVGVQLVAGQSTEAVRGPGEGLGSVDVGTGANAFMGLELPMGKWMALFAEGRAGLWRDLGRVQRNSLHIDGLGDYSGFAGLRLDF